MSNKEKVQIKSRKALDTFLSVLAEESVAKARRDVRYGTYQSEEERLMNSSRDEKDHQDHTADKLDALQKSWGAVTEPHLADEADEDIFAAIAKAAGEDSGDDKKKKKGDGKKAGKQDDVDKKPPPTDDDTDQAEPEAEPAEEPAPSEESVTFTMIRDKLNTIRSGRSLRDRDIKDELKSYVMKLDGEERGALHAFLDGIGQILTAGIDSEDAQEPSDDPYDIEMKKRDGEDAEAEPTKSTKSVKKPVDRKKQRGLEDTTAPIQVGKTAKTESIRRKIRELMGQ